jgi:hypothetical protein
MAERSPSIVARSDWLQHLRELAVRCSDGPDEDTPECVTLMNELLLVAPEPALLDGLQPLAPTRLALMLKVGAHDSAVLKMLDRGSGYLLSRSGDGHSMASIALPATAREKSAAGVNPAMALVGALALSLTSAAASARVATPRSRLSAPALLH